MYTRACVFICACSFLLTSPMNAQNVPNAGFELWQDIGGWFDNPVDWRTSNNQIQASSVVRDSQAYAGILAMKVENATGLPGYAYTYFHLEQHPATVNVYVKANVMQSDTAWIQIVALHEGKVVDSGIWYTTASIANWSLTTIPFSQESPFIDSLEVTVKAGIQFGTWISVDEFDIDFATGIGPVRSAFQWTLYPNPMYESSILSFENIENDVFTLSLYNALGQKVLTIPNILTSSITLYKGTLSKGVYVIVLSADRRIYIKGKLIVG